MVVLISLLGPLIVNIILILLIFLFWETISLKFSLSEHILIPMILYIFGRTYYIVIRKVYYGINLIANYTAIEIVSDIIILISIFTICQLGVSDQILFSFTFGYLIFSLIGLVILFFKYKIITSHLRSVKSFNYANVYNKYIKYGFITMIGNASSAGTSYLSMLFIGFYLSNSQAGIYSSVLAIISILMFIPRLFSQVLLPEFSNLLALETLNN